MRLCYECEVVAEEVRCLFLRSWTLSFANGRCYDTLWVYEWDAGVTGWILGSCVKCM